MRPWLIGKYEAGFTSRRDRATARRADLLYRYKSHDLATRIVFEQKIDVAIKSLFDIGQIEFNTQVLAVLYRCAIAIEAEREQGPAVVAKRRSQERVKRRGVLFIVRPDLLQ